MENNNLCIDCGRKISRYSKRCKSCSNKFRTGKYKFSKMADKEKELLRLMAKIHLECFEMDTGLFEIFGV